MNTRKHIRLEGYDYSQSGAYFITICTKDRLPILSTITDELVGESIARPPKPELSDIGVIVETSIQSIPVHYPDVAVENYVIMPNHVHMLLRRGFDSGRAMLAPTTTNSGRTQFAPTTIPEIVRQMKGCITKKCGKAIWQKSFYDHIIRDEQDFLEIWQYIDGNPSKWQNDDLYVPGSAL